MGDSIIVRDRDAALDRPVMPKRVNVPTPERIASGVLGAALLGVGLRRGRLGGLALATLGGLIAHRAVIGHCPVYAAVGVKTVTRPLREQIRKRAQARAQITVGGAPSEVMREFRDPAMFAQMWSELVDIDADVEAGVTHWVLRGPLAIRWSTGLVEPRAGDQLGWASRPGAFSHAGVVSFRLAPAHQGTEVALVIEFDALGASAADAALALAHGITHAAAQNALRRFKSMFEVGECATLASNPSGRRTLRATNESAGSNGRDA